MDDLVALRVKPQSKAATLRKVSTLPSSVTVSGRSSFSCALPMCRVWEEHAAGRRVE